MPRIVAEGLEEIVAEVVGGRFLFAGVLGADHGFAQLAEYGIRKDRCDIARGGDRIQGGGSEQGILVRLQGVLQVNMADFVAYDAEHFLIVHHVQEAGVHTHAAVGAGEGVDFVVLVNLEVKRGVAYLVEVLYDFRKPL